MRRSAVPVALCLALVVGPPAGASAQPIAVDLVGTWGRKAEVGVGLGAQFNVLGLPILVTGGGAFIERGLEPGLEWTDERTRIVDPAGMAVDPRDGRTTPQLHWWIRAEWSPSWFGVSGMLDPREYTGAVGAFGTWNVAASSQLVGEVRWAHKFGYDLSARLRFVL